MRLLPQGIRSCAISSMIKHLRLVCADGFDPRINLAAETALMEEVQPDELILYLWQNDNTVVIGKNQNIYKECSLAAMEKDGVIAVRRPSGGGAVYHDTGNLNFSFLSMDSDHSVSAQTQVIVKALASAGIRAEVSGRNDILVQGRKVSGNAYWHTNGRSLHHGTLLLDTDLSKMSLYLRPSAAKLKSKGVSSVRSRVMNLTEVRPGLSVKEMKEHLISAAECFYGCTAQRNRPVNKERLEELCSLYSSHEWIYGKNPTFMYSVSGRFDWGGIEIGFNGSDGLIKDAEIWSDSMDPDEIGAMKQMLEQCPFSKEAFLCLLEQCAQGSPRADMLGLLLKEETIWHSMI